MIARALDVLFLCTGNSARSILAEALANAAAGGKLRAHSAGSSPAGEVHPLALELLKDRGLAAAGLRSKSVDEFRAAGARKMDIVITLCDSAARECPGWPDAPVRGHWAIDDPAAAQGGDDARRRAFARAFEDLRDRILVFASLPLGKLERGVLERRLQDIGELGAGEPEGHTHLADRIRAASRPLKRGLLPRSAGR